MTVSSGTCGCIPDFKSDAVLTVHIIYTVVHPAGLVTHQFIEWQSIRIKNLPTIESSVYSGFLQATSKLRVSRIF